MGHGIENWTTPCTKEGFRQELLLHGCEKIGALEYGQHLGMYLPTVDKEWFFGQGEQLKLAAMIRDTEKFPEIDSNFEATFVLFPKGFGIRSDHASPLGVKKIVARMAQGLVAHRVRTMEEEPSE